jgi:hypothetical protein
LIWRGFDKLRGELGLMILCYNFTRVLTIIGLDRLVAWLVTRCLLGAMSLLATVRASVAGRRSGLCRKARIFDDPCSPAGRPHQGATGFAT